MENDRTMAARVRQIRLSEAAGRITYVTRSEWLRQHYNKEAEEADKMLMLLEYHKRPYEGTTSDPGSEED